MTHLVIAALIVGLALAQPIMAATGSQIEPSTIPHVIVSPDGQLLRTWFMVGPFMAPKNVDPVNFDFLEAFGKTECEWREADFVGLSKARHAGVGNGSVESKFTSSRSAEIDLRDVFPSQGLGGEHLTAAYAVCELEANEEQKVFMLIGSSDGAKVWLNGELQLTTPSIRALRRYEDLIQLSLRAGRNLLVVKVGNISTPWILAVRLEHNLSRAVEATSTVRRILSREVLLAASSLELTPRLKSLGAGFDVTVRRHNGDVVANLYLKPGISAAELNLPLGYYQAAFNYGGVNFQQSFVVGTLEAIRMQMKNRAAQFGDEERVALNLDAQIQRLHLLARPFVPEADHLPAVAQHYQAGVERITVYTVGELEHALLRLENGQEAFRHRPGFHLRAFRSVIDGQPQHYRLFVPSNYSADGPPIPLVIALATVFSPPRPFVDNFVIFHRESADRWADLAERLGVAVLWPGYRNEPYGNPVDFAHFDEIMIQVMGDYRIDDQRVYLYGPCSAGIIAAMEAVRRPNSYAGIALLNPVLHRVKNRFGESMDFSMWPTYRQWLKDTDPVEGLAQIRDLPIRLVHDGVDPEHGPLSDSVDFVTRARAYGNPVSFEQDKDPSGDEFIAIANLMRWMVRQKRKHASWTKEITGEAYLGPLSRAFADHFVLVEATGGSSIEQAANRKLSKAFQDAWVKLHYAPCLVIKDVDLTSEVESRVNLVLLGNPNSNRAWLRLEPRLNIKFTDINLQINELRWASSNLAVQAWCLNPDYPKRKLVLIGGANIAHVSFGTLELSLDGWFDYAVWETVDAKTALIATGRYDGEDVVEKSDPLR